MGVRSREQKLVGLAETEVAFFVRGVLESQVEMSDLRVIDRLGEGLEIDPVWDVGHHSKFRVRKW